HHALELRCIIRLAAILLQQQRRQFGRARQAADMGGENAVGAELHASSPLNKKFEPPRHKDTKKQKRFHRQGAKAPSSFMPRFARRFHFLVSWRLGGSNFFFFKTMPVCGPRCFGGERRRGRWSGPQTRCAPPTAARRRRNRTAGRHRPRSASCAARSTSGARDCRQGSSP